MTGYSKDKADQLISKHEKKAEALEERARQEKQFETFTSHSSSPLEREARAERQKADNLRALKRHHGD